MFAASQKNHVTIVEMLLASNASADTKVQCLDGTIKSPLEIAVKNGHQDVVALLSKE